MKLHDILIEAPFMVKQSGYPADFQHAAERAVALANQYTSYYQEKYRDGDVSFGEDPSGNMIIVYVDDEAIGMMHLERSRLSKVIGTPSHQVMNVWIKREHRNKGIGLKLYNYVLRQRKEGFASACYMTPASRRLYTSLLGDPSVDVYALLHNKDGTYQRQELNKRTRGLTTGSAVDDARATFVMVPN